MKSFLLVLSTLIFGFSAHANLEGGYNCSVELPDEGVVSQFGLVVGDYGITVILGEADDREVIDYNYGSAENNGWVFYSSRSERYSDIFSYKLVNLEDKVVNLYIEETYHDNATAETSMSVASFAQTQRVDARGLPIYQMTSTYFNSFLFRGSRGQESRVSSADGKVVYDCFIL